jgi:hypothetical protein
MNKSPFLIYVFYSMQSVQSVRPSYKNVVKSNTDLKIVTPIKPTIVNSKQGSKKIIWTNNLVYNNDAMTEKINFIEKQLNIFSPLANKEKQELIEFEKNYHLPDGEMVQLRNTVKIQKDIDASKHFRRISNIVKEKFIKQFTGERINNTSLEFFIKSTRMPFGHVIKLLESLPEFKNISEHNLKYINKMKRIIINNETDIRRRSMHFEYSLENYLTSQNIKYRTEKQIKESNDYTITPDILFDDPIILQLNNVNHSIKWMDAKNYMLVDIPFIIKSLNKQAAKYNKILGMGAFVFHYGIDNSISIPGTLILDGSFLP